ncbi:MerR family transcriptional regulator [Paenibacillus lautus]|uniref:MerR family transcriptional regulator n=1 Tax=Paenibacillus lautus TaxID=1401 RepID=UPI003D272C90
MGFRPKKLAEKYGLSSSTLRNYEAKGLIPPAVRSSNGYRMYTERHEAYLACIQAMAAGFGMEVTSEVMHCLGRNNLNDALWIVRDREVMLHREKASLDQLVRELKSYSEGSQAYDFNQHFSIHEVSSRTGAPKSAIRYWEQSGLFTAKRDPDNDYRLYNEAHLFKIRMFQVLQSAVQEALYVLYLQCRSTFWRAVDHQPCLLVPNQAYPAFVLANATVSVIHASSVSHC